MSRYELFGAADTQQHQHDPGAALPQETGRQDAATDSLPVLARVPNVEPGPKAVIEAPKPDQRNDRRNDRQPERSMGTKIAMGSAGMFVLILVIAYVLSRGGRSDTSAERPSWQPAPPAASAPEAPAWKGPTGTTPGLRAEGFPTPDALAPPRHWNDRQPPLVADRLPDRDEPVGTPARGPSRAPAMGSSWNDRSGGRIAEPPRFEPPRFEANRRMSLDGRARNGDPPSTADRQPDARYDYRTPPRRDYGTDTPASYPAARYPAASPPNHESTPRATYDRTRTYY